MSSEKKLPDNLEVLVDLPITDAEMFTHILTGKKPERPVRMTMGEVRSLQRIARTLLAGTLLATSIYFYHATVQEYGSLSNAYKSFMETSKKIPYNALNP